MTIIYTKNELHLGDNIFCCIAFCKIKKYIEENDIFIQHYMRDVINIGQVKQFNYSKNIQILDIADMPTDKKIYELWIGSGENEYNWYTRTEKLYDEFLCKFYNIIIESWNIPITITQFIFDDDDNDLLQICDKINNRTNNKYMNIDFLFINGEPRSGQIHNYHEWDEIIIKFSEKYNIITTKKIGDIKCTMDDELSVKDIASIAKNANKIIAIDSGVGVGLFNKHVIENVEKVYYICSHGKCKCRFPNFIYKQDIRKLLFLVDPEIYEEIYEEVDSEEIKETFEMNDNIYAILLLLIIIIFLLYYKKFKKIIFLYLIQILPKNKSFFYVKG